VTGSEDANENDAAGAGMSKTKTMPARLRAALFDLDGTLIDSAPDLAASVNIVLGLHGFLPLPLPAVVAMIGNGIRKLVERAFAANGVTLAGAALDAAYGDMMEVYGGNLTASTVLMPGARETLAAFRDAGVKIAVVTNKPQALTEAILEHFGLAALVDTAVGGDAGFERKPAPDMLLAALERLDAPRTEAIMVGDSHADIVSAKAAGIFAICVRGGYTTTAADELGADRVVDALPNLIAATSKA
jgi:phosphoglycolate phosphatase